MRKLIALLLAVLMLAALCVCVFADTDPIYSPDATTIDVTDTTGPSDTSNQGPQTGITSLPIVIAFVVLAVCAVASIFVIKPLVKKEI